MLGIYLAAALFGGIIIGVSFLVGGHDAGGDGGAPDHGGPDHEGVLESTGEGNDHPVAHDAHAGADVQWMWLPFLSVRFWTFFCASFGLTGVLLTLFGIGEPLSALVSAPFGALIGYGAAMVFQRLNTDQVSGDVGLERFIGTEAKVVLPIRPGDVGKITVQTMSGTFELPARTRDLVAIEPGRTVLIASIDGGTADVTHLKQIPGSGASTKSTQAE